MIAHEFRCDVINELVYVILVTKMHNASPGMKGK